MISIPNFDLLGERYLVDQPLVYTAPSCTHLRGLDETPKIPARQGLLDKPLFNKPWMSALHPDLLYRYWKRAGQNTMLVRPGPTGQFYLHVDTLLGELVLLGRFI